MKLSDFVKVFVAALYNETMLSGTNQFRVGQILDRYSLELAAVWRDRILSDNELNYYVEIQKHIGPVREQRVALTPEGFRWVEDEIGDNLSAFLEQHGAHYVEEIAKNEIVIGGIIDVTDNAVATVVPASDRVVGLNHNLGEYVQVRDGLDELLFEVRKNNQVGETTAHRERLINSLEAARRLWDSAELKLVQIQVGIVLAIEDAGAALKAIGKLVGIGVLIDAIKALVKACSGIEF